MSTLFIWKKFCDLTLHELYEILKVRQEVFVIEQQCLYMDLDDKDQDSLHLQGLHENRIVAYLRVIVTKDIIKIGRVLTRVEARGQGVARIMMKEALDKIEVVFPGMTVELAAQQYLQNFYASLGFEVISSPYDEDGIMHIDMRKKQ